MNEPLRLAAHGYECLLSPRMGGAILSLSFDGRQLLRPAPPRVTSILDVASFPLLPFANRIDRARFTIDGRRIELLPDVVALPHALHGFGWRRSWKVGLRNPTSAELILTHEADRWPWSFTAAQRFRLSRAGLAIEISLCSRERFHAMPAGVGIHPYFLRSPSSRISASARMMWVNDASGLAMTSVSDARFDGAALAAANLDGLDNFFEGEGSFLVEDDAMSVRIEASDAKGFHLYTPAGSAFFCVEPVSHIPNSFARGDFDSALLSPGEERLWQFRIGAI